MIERDVQLADGRNLHVYEAGDLDGAAVVTHHGTPSSGLHFPPYVEDAAQRGIRLIGYDRPGYGGSTPHPRRSVGDAARDVEAILDALEIERAATRGHSGGGPHALACAALLPDRIVAAAALAAVAPYDAEGLVWQDGMGEQNVVEFEAALAGRVELQSHLEREWATIKATPSEELRVVLATILPPVDAAVLTGELAEFLTISTRRALERSVEGWVEDDLAFTMPWGFELSAIRVPTLIWHGEQDLMVPLAHGRWLAARLPHAEIRFGAEDGHLTLSARMPEVHQWLLDRLPATVA